MNGIGKKFFMSLVIILVLTWSTYASETRKNSLMADDNILKDETNPFAYPSTIVDFSNRFIAEYVGGTGYAYGYFGVGFGVLGVLLNRYHGDLDSLNNFEWSYRDIFSMNGLKRSPSANPILDLLYGMKVGNTAVALKFSRAFNSEKEETDQTTTEGSSSVTNFNAGLSMSLGTNMNFDCAAGLTLFSFGSSIENADGTGKELKNKGGTRFDLRGKLDYKINQQIIIIPNLYFCNGGFPSLELTTKTKLADKLKTETEDWGDTSASALSLGIGANITPSEKVLGILGAYFVRSSRKIDIDKADMKSKSTVTVYKFPKLVGGVEVRPKEWLAARFGVGYGISWSSSEIDEKIKIADRWVTSTAKTSEPSQTSYTIRTGLGFRFGGFRIDTELNRELIFRQGPNVVSGRTGDLLISTSMSYEF
jgi:hypothetical protein